VTEPVVGDAVLRDVVLTTIHGLLEDLHAETSEPLALDTDLRALALDSLAAVELSARLEEACDVVIPDDALEHAATPADWLAAVGGARRDPGIGGTIDPARRVAPRPPGGTWPTAAVSTNDALFWHAAAHPELVSIRILGGDRGTVVQDLTYQDLAMECAVIAGGLTDRGVGPGDRVALMLPTGRDFFVSYLAVLHTGGVPVPLYPPSGPADLQQHLVRHAPVLANAGAAVLVPATEIPVPPELSRRAPALRSVVTPHRLRSSGRSIGAYRARDEDVALIQYTSGSTGDPKGVVLTHAQLHANIDAMGAAAGIGTADLLVSWLPLYHDMGLIAAWLAPLYFGIPLVVMSPLTFLAHPATWLRAVSDHGGTLSAAPNFAFRHCADHLGDADLAGIDLSSWRLVFDGSERVDAATIDRFVKRLEPWGFRREAVCPAYGLAEVGVGVAFSTPGAGPHLDTVARGRLEIGGVAEPIAGPGPDSLTLVSCGKALPGYEIRVVDRDGAALGDRVEGAVECRGPSATAGYHANPGASTDLWRGDWLVTGDLGYLADGELFLTGRSKDLIIRAGRNVHPEDVEAEIGSLPGMVPGAVAVFARPHHDGEEELVVVFETSEEDGARLAALEHAIRQVSIERFDVRPGAVVHVRPGAIPRTASAKIRRQATRDALASGALAGAPISPARTPEPIVVPAGERPIRPPRPERTGVVDVCFAAYVWILVGIVVPPLWLTMQLPLPLRTRWTLARRAAALLCRLAGVDLRVDGRLEGDGGSGGRGVVVVANHESVVDGVVVLLAMEDPVVFVSSTDLRRQLVLGRLLGRIGSVFAARGEARTAEAAVRQLSELAASGHTVVVFPEGKLESTDRLDRFHLGAFAAAVSASVPVVPVGIRGSGDVWRSGTRFPRRGRISVEIGDPITPPGTGFSGAVALRDAARAAVDRLRSTSGDAGA